MDAEANERGGLFVPRLDMAVDCAFTVSPEHVRSQMEGACMTRMGLVAKSAITFQNGRVDQANFSDYEVSRIDGAPRIVRVHVVPAGYDVPPGGICEPGCRPSCRRSAARH